MIGPSEEPPITDARKLSSESESRLKRQLRYELERAYKGWTPPPLNQEEFAHILGFDGAGHVSAMLTGRETVTKKAADALDTAGVLTSLGTSFGSLRDALASAMRRERPIGRRRLSPLDMPVFDVFLSSPMAALDGETYQKQRDDANSFAAEIKAHCGLTVYYAGRDIATADEFDDEALAVQKNLSALLESKYFVLLITEELRRYSTSVLVEAGMALTLGKPSIYFVSDLEYLPYILRRIGDSSSRLPLPPVSVEVCVGGLGRAIGLLRRNGRELFTRLDNPAATLT